MGNNHYMIVMPSLVKQFFLKRPSVISSDEFWYVSVAGLFYLCRSDRIQWIMNKYFDDGGSVRKMPPDEFHTVNHTLTSLMIEPFLSDATGVAEELTQQRMPHIHSFAPQSTPESERRVSRD